ncbi:Hypothetical predicted protein [Paramuricea clavata]|uniref:Uncharacterized protein n=1 Tax=Paramuricea clavata TaxID=317549 RepID=A0A7D9L0I0_PARCT|nr:Hypothetical predicted protein [Paramuricea clavata]
MARIITGARGIGRVLVEDGFKYQFNRQSQSTMHWRCWRTTCGAKLKTNLFDRNDEDPNVRVVEREQHDHEEDDAVIQKGIFLNDAKGSVRDDPTRPIKRVYDQHVSAIHREAGGSDQEIPDFQSVRSQMSRVKSAEVPDTPQDIDDVNIEGSWARSWRNKRFLLHQDNDWGIAIFGTRRNLCALDQCQQLYMDATFRTAPRPYEQVFTILGEYYGRVLPLAIVLMTNRAIGHYRQVLQVLQRKIRRATGSEWEPEAIVCDFEQALITAIQTKLPNTRIEGCYFHFNQSLWRHVKDHGLTRAYRNHERVKKLIRKVMSIGFLPTAIVRNNFALLRTENRTRRLFRRYPGLVEFFNYVFNNYINGNFPVTLWNVYDRDMDCRTNNNAEGFHRAWNNRVQVRHPNLWIFIRHLKDLQAQTNQGIRSMDNGGQPTRRRRRWQRLENQLQRLKTDYIIGVRDVQRCWNAVSHLVTTF